MKKLLRSERVKRNVYGAATFIVAVLVLSGFGVAATRLTYDLGSTSTAIFWSAPSFPLRYAVDPSIAAKFQGGEQSVAAAFNAWVNPQQSSVKFLSAGVVPAPAGKDGQNSITVNDKLFADSGFIAYTTTWFEDSGRIVEADIQIDSVAIRDYSFQAVLQHEVGHLLGLDHSGIVSSVMFPYVSKEPSALDSDDQIALADIYPTDSFKESRSTLRGEVRDARGGIFAAQVVAVNAKGSPVASTLTGRDGKFEIRGLPEGDYSYYAEPLNGPLDRSNLSGVWRGPSAAQFRTEFAGTPRQASAKNATVTDNLVININDLPAILNPKWIGSFDPSGDQIRLGSTATTIRTGQSVAIAVGGDGFISGMTKFEIMSQGVVRKSDFKYGSNFVWAVFQVATETTPGSAVVKISSGDETATLTGAVRVEKGSGSGRSRGAR